MRTKDPAKPNPSSVVKVQVPVALLKSAPPPVEEQLLALEGNRVVCNYAFACILTALAQRVSSQAIIPRTCL